MRSKPPDSLTGCKRHWTLMFIVLAAAIMVAAGSQNRQAEPLALARPSTLGEAKITRPDFQKIKGRWLRPDGGYIVEIKAVDGKGKMDAAYFNPNPIHIARAQASQSGKAIQVFMELRDINYPGSTYNLSYDPASDRLTGSYYQAIARESYKIYFERAK